MKVRIKNLNYETDKIASIHFDARVVSCWLVSPEEGDPSEFDFEEIIFLDTNIEKLIDSTSTTSQKKVSS